MELDSPSLTPEGSSLTLEGPSLPAMTLPRVQLFVEEISVLINNAHAQCAS